VSYIPSLPPLKLARAIAQLVHWRATLHRTRLDYRPDDLPDRFITAQQAVAQIEDGMTVMSGGFAATGRCSVFFWGVRRAFLRTGHPANLTWMSVSAQGARGKVGGSIEELAVPGLLKSYISGHLETARALLKQAAEGQLELHTLPQGELCFLLEAQARGEDSYTSTTGLGTFLDPATGGGTALTPHPGRQWVRREGEALVYSLPRIDVGLMSASYADIEGNLYFTDAPLFAENKEIAAATRANNGKVFAVVADIIEKDASLVDIPAEQVDGIVINRQHEQITGVLQKHAWDMFTPRAGSTPESEAVALTRMINRISGAAPVRGPLEQSIGRIAARLFVDHTPPGSFANIGIGLPEQVSATLAEKGYHKKVQFSTEAGALGGIPVPGMFFGAAINPDDIRSSTWMFRQYESRLDTTVLGFLEVDSAGNVNVSHRGDRIEKVVGPGGFCNICKGARTIIFTGSWMIGGRMAIEGDALRIKKPGTPKFVEQVHQITFNGQRGLSAGKNIYYATNVGYFKLTEAGLQLEAVVPGIDIQHDILDVSGARIVVPANGVPTLPASTLTGKGFDLPV
jgi:propionate CoA-transferase